MEVVWQLLIQREYLVLKMSGNEAVRAMTSCMYYYCVVIRTASESVGAACRLMRRLSADDCAWAYSRRNAGRMKVLLYSRRDIHKCLQLHSTWDVSRPCLGPTDKTALKSFTGNDAMSFPVSEYVRPGKHIDEETQSGYLY